MKYFKYLFLVLFAVSCTKNNTGAPGFLTLQFTHNWDGNSLTAADFNILKFTNEQGVELRIEGLRYLVSNVDLEKANGEHILLKGYQLIDLLKPSSLEYQPSFEIPEGSYKNISFRFGFADEDNIEGAYQDLNSELWNVPQMLGGGYHYMQFDGKFLDANQNLSNFNYHAIRAVNRANPQNPIYEDTSFIVNLGALEIRNGTFVEVRMNVAEWFKNPNSWDLNLLNINLMSNFDAQLLMKANGQTVFSRGTIY